MKKELTCVFVEYTVSARCASARPVFFLSVFPSAFCARRSGACCVIHAGPASSRVRSSADPVDRRGAGAHHNNCMSTQHFMSILTGGFYKTWPRLFTV